MNVAVDPSVSAKPAGLAVTQGVTAFDFVKQVASSPNARLYLEPTEDAGKMGTLHVLPRRPTSVGSFLNKNSVIEAELEVNADQTSSNFKLFGAAEVEIKTKDYTLELLSVTSDNCYDYHAFIPGPTVQKSSSDGYYYSGAICHFTFMKTVDGEAVYPINWKSVQELKEYTIVLGDGGGYGGSRAGSSTNCAVCQTIAEKTKGCGDDMITAIAAAGVPMTITYRKKVLDIAKIEGTEIPVITTTDTKGTATIAEIQNDIACAPCYYAAVAAKSGKNPELKGMREYKIDEPLLGPVVPMDLPEELKTAIPALGDEGEYRGIVGYNFPGAKMLLAVIPSDLDGKVEPDKLTYQETGLVEYTVGQEGIFYKDDLDILKLAARSLKRAGIPATYPALRLVWTEGKKYSASVECPAQPTGSVYGDCMPGGVLPREQQAVDPSIVKYTFDGASWTSAGEIDTRLECDMTPCVTLTGSARVALDFDGLGDPIVPFTPGMLVGLQDFPGDLSFARGIVQEIDLSGVVEGIIVVHFGTGPRDVRTLGSVYESTGGMPSEPSKLPKSSPHSAGLVSARAKKSESRSPTRGNGGTRISTSGGPRNGPSRGGQP
jgi:hypothetical protein